MSSQQTAAVALGIVPRAPRVPRDMAVLNDMAVLSFCPVPGAARRARVDYIACMIDTALVEAGR